MKTDQSGDGPAPRKGETLGTEEGGSDSPAQPAPLALKDALDENERLRIALEEAEGKRRERSRNRWRRGRRILVGLLVFLTALSVLASTVAIWVHASVFQTDRFVSLIKPAVEDPAVTDPLANQVSNQLFQALNLQDRVTAALPPNLRLIVPPLTTATRDYVRDKVTEVFRSPGFHERLLGLIAQAHEKAVALVRGQYEKLPNVVVKEGEVRLNLLPIVTEALRRVVQGAAGLFGASVQIPVATPSDQPGPILTKLSQALGRPLPPDFGQVAVLTTAQLAPLQDAVKQFDRFVVFGVILALVLLVLTLILSTNRRRTLVQLAVAVVAAFLVAGVAIRRIRDAVLDHIVNDAGRAAAGRVSGSLLASLRGLTTWVAVLGIAVAVCAYLIGRPRWFVKLLTRARALVRRRPSGSEFTTWVASRADALRFAGIAIAVVTLLIVGVGLASFVVIGGLLILYEWGVAALHRRVQTGGAEPSA